MGKFDKASIEPLPQSPFEPKTPIIRGRSISLGSPLFLINSPASFIPL